jgi:hypothetical protein
MEFLSLSGLLLLNRQSDYCGLTRKLLRRTWIPIVGMALWRQAAKCQDYLSSFIYNVIN